MTFGEASGGAAFPGSDKVMHSSLVTAWGDLIFAADTMPEINHQPGDTVAVSLSGPDEALDTQFRALADGGQVHVPYEKQMWGDVYGQVRDRFGVLWHVNRTAEQ